MNKKEIIRKYKETVQPMGVYQIKNLKNHKLFIGSTKDIRARINRIKFQLKTGSYSHKEIQQDYFEAGETGFSVEVLDLLSTIEHLDENYDEELELLEQLWLDKIQPYGDKGYNKIKNNN
ncbi:GIY-YIG nuclease family protein [bacterium]|nr:GIY-YIG nuclease family protein [bacterium]